MTAPTIRLKLPAVRRAVQAMPWAILPEKGAAILDLVQLRATGKRYGADEIQARMGDGRKPLATKGGGIQVLPLIGTVMHRASMFADFSGGCSVQDFARTFSEAMNDPNVSAIVIDCDSPGGSVDGVPELAKLIFDARGKGKRIVAVANTLMASAAYWIASAADEVVVTPSGMVGSIGVFMVHLDESAFDSKVGLAYTLISAGEYKTEGNPYEPLSDEARAALQAQVDEFYGLFVGAVAKYRGATPKDVRTGYGQGRVLGAKAAVAAGLADRVDTLDGVLAKLGVKGTVGGRPMVASDTAPAVTAAVTNTTGMTGRLLTDDAVARIVAAVMTPEEMPDGEPDMDPDDVCPDCGGMMENGRCAACGYTKTETTDPDTAARGGASGTSDSPPATTRPHAATEEVMPNENGAAPGNGADTVAAAIAAERKRASDIRALGASLERDGITAELIEAQVNSGATVDQASRAFLGTIAARREAAPRIEVGADREADRPFAKFGEQLFAIIQAGRPGGAVDRRLLAVNAKASRFLAGPSGMNESIGSEGGFFIAPEVLPQLYEPMYTEDPILSRVTRIPSDRPNVKYKVVDETSRATGSRWGGVQVYRVGEGETGTSKKPKLREMELSKKKLMGLAYLTDELMQDGPAAEALLTRAFQAEFSFVIADEIFRGTGAGQMFGFLKSPAFQSQAIEGGQTIANSPQYIALNTSKMLSRIPAGLLGGVIWLYNQELFPYIVTATLGTGGSAMPIFLPAGGMSGRPYDTIWGKPAFASELCEAVGTPGDIVAIVPSEFHMLADGGVSQMTSLHVRFLYDEQVLRITHRNDGAPVWTTAVTPYKGALSRTPFVGLATRA